MEEVREPQAAASGFYPVSRSSLLRTLENLFKNSDKGPGSTPIVGSKKGLKNIVGGVVPHAGYSYSGYCAAWFYKELGDYVDRVDTVVIMGTNHTGFGGKITTTTYYRKWSTPIGSVEVDMDFIKRLKELYPNLDDDALAHTGEHSVEVQLPFLQYIYGDRFKLVPIVVKDLTLKDAVDFATALRKAVDIYSGRVLVLASSDFTHHGYVYGYVLFNRDIPENVKKLDLMFIENIVKLDTENFLSLIAKYNATVCGYGAIAIAMEYAKTFNTKAELLKYYNSYEISGDEDIIVGYAAIEFYTQ